MTRKNAKEIAEEIFNLEIQNYDEYISRPIDLFYTLIDRYQLNLVFDVWLEVKEARVILIEELTNKILSDCRKEKIKDILV